MRPVMPEHKVTAAIVERSVCAMATIRMFSTKPYDTAGFLAADRGHELVFLDARLDATTVDLAAGADAVCVFVNDDLSAEVVEALHGFGVRCIALRCRSAKTAAKFSMRSMSPSERRRRAATRWCWAAATCAR